MANAIDDVKEWVLIDALKRIAEGNLGDDPWQANYARIRQVASEALSKSVEPESASERFGRALTELPKLAAAAGCYVGIKVTEAKPTQVQS